MTRIFLLLSLLGVFYGCGGAEDTSSTSDETYTSSTGDEYDDPDAPEFGDDPN